MGIISLLLLTMLIGCQENLQDVQQTNNKKSGKVIIQITDAPLPLELVKEANVTVDWVKLGSDWKAEEDAGDEAEDEKEGFHLIEMEEAMTFNLLELSNGVTALLAETEMPAGEYNEIRLHIISAEIVFKDGSVYDLKVPGGGSRGLKVKINPSIIVTGGAVAEILLDFDVSRSFIVKGNLGKGNGKGKGKKVVNGFIFKPVVRAVNKTSTGQISGLVNDTSNVALENAMMALISENDTITTALTDEEGFYALIGVPEGAYSVACSKEGYVEEVAGDVEVISGNITEQNFELVMEEEDSTED